MMRYRNELHEGLYQKYADIGNKIAKYSAKKNNIKLSHQYGWKLITKNGIWKLSLRQECILAIQGLGSTFNNFEFFSQIVSQLSALYLISKYSSDKNKQLYLSRLTNGEMSIDIFPEGISFVNILPLKDRNLILCDCMNFKRILYGFQATSFSLSIGQKHLLNPQEKIRINEVMTNLFNCEKIFYAAIN